MTLQQLEYVIALSKHKNFEKAAEICFVTQPTLSMQLKKLEEEIGFLIFDRTKKPLQQTPFGTVFIDKATVILEEVSELKAIVNHDIFAVEGEYRLGIIPTLAPYILPLLLPEIAAKHPKTNLIIYELQSEDIIERLKVRSLDIAILATPLEEKSLDENIIFYEPFYGYFPDGHSQLNNKFIDINDLDLNELLVLEEGHCFRNQTLRICQVKDKYSAKNISYQSGSIETIKRLIEKGMGFSLIPALSKEIGTNPKLLRAFSAPIPAREVSLVSHRNFHKTGIKATIKRIILENLPPEFETGNNIRMIKWR